MSKKILNALIVASLVFSVSLNLSLFDVHAEESMQNIERKIESFETTNPAPYPTYKWINLGTLKLDPVTVNKVQDAKKLFGTAIFAVTGKLLPFTELPMGYLASLIDSGHTTFYVTITQYVSEDYEWHYFTYSVYEDANCTKYIKGNYCAKWRSRAVRSHQIENNLIL